MSGFSFSDLPGGSSGNNTFGFVIRFAPPNNDYQSYFSNGNTVSVDWEIILGSASISQLNLPTSAFQAERDAGQYATVSDFAYDYSGAASDYSSLRGTATFDLLSQGYQTFVFRQHDFGSHGSYELDEVYAVRLSNPTDLVIEYGTEKLFIIDQERSNVPYLTISGDQLSFVEGESSPLMTISSNFKEDYFIGKSVDVVLTIADRDYYHYAGHNDFFASRIEASMPLLNDSSWQLDELRAFNDGLDEGSNGSGIEYGELDIAFGDYALYDRNIFFTISDPKPIETLVLASLRSDNSWNPDLDVHTLFNPGKPINATVSATRNGGSIQGVAASGSTIPISTRHDVAFIPNTSEDDYVFVHVEQSAPLNQLEVGWNYDVYRPSGNPGDDTLRIAGDFWELDDIHIDGNYASGSNNFVAGDGYDVFILDAIASDQFSLYIEDRSSLGYQYLQSSLLCQDGARTFWFHSYGLEEIRFSNETLYLADLASEVDLAINTKVWEGAGQASSASPRISYILDQHDLAVQYGLYLDSSDNVFVSDSFLEIGDILNGSEIILSSPILSASIRTSGLSAVRTLEEEGYGVLMVSGEGSRASGTELLFDGNGEQVSSRRLKAGDLIAEEQAYGEDLNGDDVVGDGIIGELDLEDASGNRGLYVFSSGGLGISGANLSVGDVPGAGEVVRLLKGNRPVGEARNVSVTAVRVLEEEGYGVLMVSGEGSRASGTELLFDGNGGQTGTNRISSADIIDYEALYDQDLDSDGFVGLPITEVDLGVIASRSTNADVGEVILHSGRLQQGLFAESFLFSLEADAYAYFSLYDFSYDLDLYLYRDNPLGITNDGLIFALEAPDLEAEFQFSFLPAGAYIAAVSPYDELPAEGATYEFEIDTHSFLDQSVLPNDPLFAQQWHLFNVGQASGLANEDITVPEAWFVRTGSPDVVVAVIDEGIQLDHPDLVNNLWTNPGEVPGNGLDDDANGYVDDVHGYNFSSDTSLVFADPDFSHGTHVAGIIGAEGNNGIGIAGVSWDVQLMSLDVLGPGDRAGQFSTVWEAVYYAADNGADVINMSLGADLNMTLSQFKRQNPLVFNEGFNALSYAVEKGVSVVIAAGNDSNSFDTGWISMPAIYSDVIPGVISVASVGNTGELASYSNYGSKVTIAAPGGDFGEGSESLILSSYPYDDYQFLAGTSMAAPVVTGAVALVKAENPSLTPQQIQSLLEETAWMYKDLEGFVHNGYFLDLSDALSNAADFNSVGSAALLPVSGRQASFAKNLLSQDELIGAFGASRASSRDDLVMDGGTDEMPSFQTSIGSTDVVYEPALTSYQSPGDFAGAAPGALDAGLGSDGQVKDILTVEQI